MGLPGSRHCLHIWACIHCWTGSHYCIGRAHGIWLEVSHKSQAHKFPPASCHLGYIESWKPVFRKHERKVILRITCFKREQYQGASLCLPVHIPCLSMGCVRHAWWRPWQKTTIYHNVEFLSPEPSNTSTTQPMHLSLRDHYIQNQGRKHCRSQKNKKFTVIFLSLEISEEYHEVSSTWPKQGWHQQTY